MLTDFCCYLGLVGPPSLGLLFCSGGQGSWSSLLSCDVFLYLPVQTAALVAPSWILSWPVNTSPPAARIWTPYCLPRTTTITPAINPQPHEDPQTIEHTPLSALTLSNETPEALTLNSVHLWPCPPFPSPTVTVTWQIWSWLKLALLTLHRHPGIETRCTCSITEITFTSNTDFPLWLLCTYIFGPLLLFLWNYNHVLAHIPGTKSLAPWWWNVFLHQRIYSF